jgi:hypothetical protein
MTYTVTLTKQISDNVGDEYQPEAVRVIYTVTAFTGFVDAGVFVYRRNAAVPTETDYSHVASPSDLQDYNYAVIGTKDFVRLNTLDAVYTTYTIAQAAVVTVEAKISDLCKLMGILTVFNTTITTTIS